MSLYLTNYLILRRPFPKRINPLIRRSHAALATLSGSYSSLWGTFPRVTQPSAARHHFSLQLQNKFRTKVRSMLPLDLHVLGAPPAFILSQDQTLHKKIVIDKSMQPITQYKLTMICTTKLSKFFSSVTTPRCFAQTCATRMLSIIPHNLQSSQVLF